MNKLKICNISILVKIILSLFITYLILFQGDAGIIIHNIGNFIVSGNSFIGLLMLLSIFAIYPAIVYNYTKNDNYLNKKRNLLIGFDSILIFINLVIGIFYYTHFIEMPLSDAFAKLIVLANGSGVIYILISSAVLLLIRYLVKKEDENEQEITKINNVPLLFNGRIERIPYIATKVIFYLFLIVMGCIKQHYSKDLFDVYQVIYLISVQIIFVLSFYAASKRLRDINWSQWLLVIWSIPIIGICIGFPLLFVKNKQA